MCPLGRVGSSPTLGTKSARFSSRFFFVSSPATTQNLAQPPGSIFAPCPCDAPLLHSNSCHSSSGLRRILAPIGREIGVQAALWGYFWSRKPWRMPPLQACPWCTASMQHSFLLWCMVFLEAPGHLPWAPWRWTAFWWPQACRDWPQWGAMPTSNGRFCSP